MITRNILTDNRIWSVVSTSGALVQGSYGHSSVWDPLTKRIYVYGGYRSESSSIYELTNALYSYDPAQKVWRTHPSSGSYRYLHSAVMSGGLMLVYGGNTHNETAISNVSSLYERVNVIIPLIKQSLRIVVFQWLSFWGFIVKRFHLESTYRKVKALAGGIQKKKNWAINQH